jgi:hypothetical protein
MGTITPKQQIHYPKPFLLLFVCVSLSWKHNRCLIFHLPEKEWHLSPFCSCRWRGYLGTCPSRLSGISNSVLAWCPWTQLQGWGLAAGEPQSDHEHQAWLRVSRTALSSLFLFQRAAGRSLKTCSLFMSLSLGSLPPLISGPE